MSDAALPPVRKPGGLRTAGIVAVLLAGGVVVAGVVTRHNDTDAAQQWSDARSVPTVHLVAAKGDGGNGQLTLPGTMQAWTSAKLYARVGGYVRAWYKDIGAPVSAGTPLGSIDTPDLDQQIAQARAGLVSAQAHAQLAHSTAARWNDLVSTNSVSRQEADEKNGDLAVRNAAVAAARADLGRLLALKAFATVRAPFAGVVTQRNADIGDLVGPGASQQQPLFAVADLHRIRLYVSVPQGYSASVHPGMAATLTVPDYPGRTFPAHVTGTSGAIDPQAGTFQVELEVDNPGNVLKPGGYAQVHFNGGGATNVVTIPSSTLVFRAGGTEVATVTPAGRVTMQRVTLGRDLGGTVEVVSGVHAGDKVVDNPPDSIANGERVRVGAGTHG